MSSSTTSGLDGQVGASSSRLAWPKSRDEEVSEMRIKQGMYMSHGKTAKFTDQKVRKHQGTTGKPRSSAGLSKSKGIGSKGMKARGSY